MRKPDKWAVMAPNGRTTMRVFDTQREANEYASEINRRTHRNHRVEYRKGDEIRTPFTKEERAERQRAAIRKYQSKTSQLLIRFNQDTETDLIERLNEVDNKAGYVKALIRRDMEKSGRAIA